MFKTRKRTITPRHLKRLFEKRILKRKFNRRQAQCLVNWFQEFSDFYPNVFENEIHERDQEALESKIIEINEAFFDWCEENKTLDPKIWGNQ